MPTFSCCGRVGIRNRAKNILLAVLLHTLILSSLPESMALLRTHGNGQYLFLHLGAHPTHLLFSACVSPLQVTPVCAMPMLYVVIFYASEGRAGTNLVVLLLFSFCSETAKSYSCLAVWLTDKTPVVLMGKGTFYVLANHRLHISYEGSQVGEGLCCPFDI